ncbi:phasin family protein [Laspinema olomoucense]|uniref:phasin family protein n=1 Tax=Laspinema olomoucense TaxID=3231600 RepID=UPI0021BB08D3|nr:MULTISPECIES: phasin family protein [unclassified Laspinema]MCT7974381.1 phasin family protein [Laspinema sp. D3d]MCT7992006.1 phasin family protein [Laspinema sp. D3a]MCT7994421.1 phasin family protein [Laspinema sp. D3c]
MPGFGDIVQKAFYLGVGIASYAGEQATGRLAEVREKAQKLADEMVARGEMSTEEARRFVEDMMKQGQQQIKQPPSEPTTPREPRRIEILEDDEEPAPEKPPEVNNLRDQVQSLQDELRRLQNE